jgi:hypothetical protein
VSQTDDSAAPAGAHAGTAGYAQLRALAEAMADSLEDLIHCEHHDEMWERARAAWQAYVDWADTPAEGRP